MDLECRPRNIKQETQQRKQKQRVQREKTQNKILKPRCYYTQKAGFMFQ